MKKLIFLAALFLSSSAFAADFEAIAFERLASEITTAPDNSAKVDSVAAYFSSLDRLGASPKSSKNCLELALAGVAGDSCRSTWIEARAGGSTGGAD